MKACITAGLLATLFITGLAIAQVDAVSYATSDSSEAYQANPANYHLEPDWGIETVPASLGNEYVKHFNRYTKITAPNGKAIHIVAQQHISNDQIIRARNLLQHFLTNLPGSKYGADKSAVANQMADNNATLALLNGRDDGQNQVRVRAQPLFEDEIQVEGHPWYINQVYEGHRDASFEEILHLVHDYGIGVDGPNTSPGAAPEFQAEIRAAQKNALENKLWADDPRAKRWIEELTEENSLSQEYLAALIDVYYGLWGAFKKSEKGMHGLYVAKTRDDIAGADPMGAELMNNTFFHDYLTYNARIAAEFQGTFSLTFDESLPYTHHSRYLKDITFTGNRDANVRVNGRDNDITGNEGTNTVIFSGRSSDYTIEHGESGVIVKDKRKDQDGANTLRNVEWLKFTDKTVRCK